MSIFNIKYNHDKSGILYFQKVHQQKDPLHPELYCYHRQVVLNLRLKLFKHNNVNIFYMK